MQGIIQSVQTSPGGDYPLEAAPIGATEILFADASDFDPIGGQLDIDGAVLDYASADLEEDTVTLVGPLTFDLAEDIFVATVPATESVHAVVALGDDVVLAEVPHHLKPMLPEGEREPGAGEAVIIEEVAAGAWRVADVAGSHPAFDARFILNADELLLANKQMLGEKLAENDIAITEAQGELSTAQQRINDAFSEIDLKADPAYVDAAKQQAIDAAAIDAQAKADEAEADAVAAAQTALTAAETALQSAIASGDAAAIADAEAKIAAAKAQAIDAAADDAATKASAAQAAAETTAQSALDQAEIDLQAAIANGDAAAIADAEAKIATAKAEAIAAAADDATAKAAEAMQKANAALTAAQSAQATADNAIRTYYAETPPWANNTTQPDDVLGDMWYQDSTGQAYRWNGTTWKVIQDASIGEALAAAAAAQTTADGKITAFYQDTEPLEADEGDIWFDTNNGSAIHRRTGGAWSALLDPAALANAAQQAAITAAAADATAKAEAAEAAAAATAAADAQSKADAAQAAAEAAAQTYADSVAAGESGEALTAAKTYAEQQAEAARIAAEAASALDATAKAEAAEAAAAATAAADATSKANAAQAAAVAAAEAIEGRALSRGTDLVTNGTAYLGNNYNFSQFDYDPSDAPPGANGSFTSDTNSNRQVDEPIPVSAGKEYQYTAWARQQVAGLASQSSFYICIVPLDAADQVMSPVYYAYIGGTTTTLAQDLNPGDTTVVLTDASGWWPNAASHQRRFSWWNWTDAFGRTWPKETYTRDTYGSDIWPDNGISGNTITLRAPYSGPFRPAGSELSQGQSGGSYMYLQGRNYAEEEWTRYSDKLAPYQQLPPNSGRSAATLAGGIPPGAAKVRLQILTNHSSTGGPNGGRQAFAGISLSDASAAQVTADEAKADAVRLSAEAEAAAIAAAAADATAKAEAAEAAAAATAAADAQAKADAAQAAAEAAAQVYANTVASGAEADAIAAAAADATSKANAAQAAAEAAAALDATAKAEAAEAAAAATAAADATAKADAAQAAAIAAAAADATAKANTAENNAKAYALTTTNGLAKTIWSTALPGTTTAPANSTWYHRDATGGILSVFNQMTSPSGNNWQARPITSEAIDYLDVGKLTSITGIIDDLVAQTFATKLANIIEANIGNLVVTGDTHLDDVVAQRIMADTAAFLTVTTQNLAAGAVTAEKISGGAIDGKVITGATVQTNPPGSYPRIALAPGSGITAEDLDGTTVFQVTPEGQLTAQGAQIEGDFITSTSGAYARLGKDDNELSGILELYSEHYSETSPAKIVGTLLYPATDYGLHLISPRYENGATSTITIAGDRPGGVGGGVYIDTGVASTGLIQLTSSAAEVNVNTASVEFKHNGDTALWLLEDGGGRGVRSTDIYNRTYSSSANVFVTAAGTLGRSTSASKYKILTEPLRDVEDPILSLTPKTWIDKEEAETVADLSEAIHKGRPTTTGNGKPLYDVGTLRRIPGLIAEDVVAAGLAEFVVRDESGEVEGLMYDRIAVALIPSVKRQRDRIEALEDRLSALENRLNAPGTGD